MLFKIKDNPDKKISPIFDRNLDTLIALLPAAVAGAVYFGHRALFMMLLCMVTGAVAEWAAGRLLRVPADPRDLSAAVCSLLIAMTMPSGFSIPAAMCCTAAAVIIGRVMFGGNGCEIVSPAALGAVLAFVCFPSLIKYNDAFTHLPVDAIAVSPNADGYSFLQLLFGAHAGAIGETPAIFLLAGALYLFIRRVASPIIPLAAVCSTAIFSLIFGMNILPALMGGGLLLGTVFMLTNKDLCPHHITGKIAYGFICGLITVIIRRFAAAEEGVYFAILTVNILRPLFSAIPDFKREVKKNEAVA